MRDIKDAVQEHRRAQHRGSHQRHRPRHRAAQAAGNLIGSNDIKDDSIRSSTSGTARCSRDFSDGRHDRQLKGDTGPRATRCSGHPAAGPGSRSARRARRGEAGLDGLLGAFYATAYYDAGDTNAGAIASVACDGPRRTSPRSPVACRCSASDARVRNTRNTPVSSSFPGRMDWSTNTPKVDRLDGWIVQFGGNAGAVSDKAPEKVKVWALCVPNTDIPVQQTYTQAG